MTHFSKKFIVEPGSKPKLSSIAPDEHGDHATHQEAAAILADNVQRLDQLQYLLYAEKKHALLIVLQGLDAGGKDGVVRHVLASMNPAGCTVTGFKQPTPEEAAHDYLWRVHPHVPPKGAVAIFNRSHYEDVLVVRVHDLIRKREWSRRYEQINEFERLLVEENNTTILKFFLHISKEEQLARFRERLDDPARQWKISESDYQERELWDAYMEAYEDMFAKTSTKKAPWFIIPSNHKWFRSLAISEIIADTLANMDLKTPAPTVSLDDIRKKYHQAEAQERAERH